MRSRLLKAFVDEITNENRNPHDIRAFELLNDLSSNPEIYIDKKTTFYRCRIVDKGARLGTIKEKGAWFYGFGPNDSFVAPANKTRDMRANYRYIPYLYCSTVPYLAAAETRPRLGSIISMATVVNKENLRLFDLRLTRDFSCYNPRKRNVLLDLSEMFSKPVTEEDDTLDYLPTQFAAEYIKKLGYDGIAYSSSVVPYSVVMTKIEYNIVIFNYDKMMADSSHLYQTEEASYHFTQIDRSIERLGINSPSGNIMDMREIFYE